MTYKEKVRKERPENINKNCGGGVVGCPHSEVYGYEEEPWCGDGCGHHDGKCEECWNREIPTTKEAETQTLPSDEGYELIQEAYEYSEAYNKGLQDAWELARKISVLPTRGGMDDEGTFIFDDVLIELTPQEALAKMKAYEAQTIKVGDVVEFADGTKAVVIDIDTDDSLALLTESGCAESWIKPEIVKKTSKHIDIIESIIGQIRSE